MNEILSRKLVPASKSQLNCLLRDHKEGKQIIDNDWNSRGQPRLLKDKDITKISDALEKESGKTIGENELISIIKDTRSKNIEAAGLVPICATKNPSRTSVNNYKCVLASQASVSITTTAISKTNNRYTAENSLISAMAFLIVVASTHFILANEENDEIRKEMKDAPKGVKCYMTWYQKHICLSINTKQIQFFQTKKMFTPSSLTFLVKYTKRSITLSCGDDTALSTHSIKRSCFCSFK